MALIYNHIYTIDNVVYEDNSPVYTEPCVFVGKSKRYLLHDFFDENWIEVYADGWHEVEFAEPK